MHLQQNRNGRKKTNKKNIVNFQHQRKRRVKRNRTKHYNRHLPPKRFCLHQEDFHLHFIIKAKSIATI